MAKALWPSGTVDSQVFQISSLSNELSTIKTQMETTLNAGLGLVMNDVPTFINFASSGAFSGHESLSLPNVTNGLDFALRTYMTSESLAQNGFHALIIGTFEESTFNQPNCAQVSGGIICSETGDKSHYDQSDGTFWSNISKRMYLLSKNSGGGTSYPVLNAINVNGWANLQTLFDGAYSCTFNGMNSF